ncbi:hypothetical protein NHG32_06975 [Aerococcaceae bacterium NML191219]|nr:hypothetical protein [Aerococcaceae bacterium NML191219]
MKVKEEQLYKDALRGVRNSLRYLKRQERTIGVQREIAACRKRAAHYGQKLQEVGKKCQC